MTEIESMAILKNGPTYALIELFLSCRVYAKCLVKKHFLRVPFP